MQNNSKVDVRNLVRATQKIYESRYENPVLEKNQTYHIEQFVVDTSNQLCAKMFKKIKLGLL